MINIKDSKLCKHESDLKEIEKIVKNNLYTVYIYECLECDARYIYINGGRYVGAMISRSDE
jgi:hypothetical protein